MVSYILLVKYIDSTEEVVSLFEVDLQKPRNLSAHESEDSDSHVSSYPNGPH